MPRCIVFLFAIYCALAAGCTNYRKETNGGCADICLNDQIGICPVSIIVQYGGLTKGLCSEVGYTTADGTLSQKAGPCGTLTFNKYVKPAVVPVTSALIAIDEIPDNLEETHCKWGLTSCSPSHECSFQPRLGDYTLNQACRLRSSAVCANVTPQNIAVDQYFSGRWFEIAASASFKNRYEKGLECIFADYYVNHCDKEHPVVVLNNGVRSDNSWNRGVGKARSQGGAPGKFEVSFFGPFYGSYWIIHTQPNGDHPYGIAIVFSCTKGATDLWVLSRTPQLPTGVTLDSLLEVARSQGVNVEELSMVETPQEGGARTCDYPSPQAVSEIPSSDAGCSFGLTGCTPASWCWYQYRFGDWNPSMSCRLKPTQC